MSEMKTLVAKLNPVCHQAMERAAELCVAQTNFNVEVEHFLCRMLEQTDTDLSYLLRYHDVEAAGLRANLERAIDGFKRGNGRTPMMSPHIPLLLQEAWKVASLEFELSEIRSGAVAAALVKNETLKGLVGESAPALLKLSETPVEDIRQIISPSSEESESTRAAPPDDLRPAPGAPSETPQAADSVLDRYTVDLTAEAIAGKIDPVRSRDREIRQIIDILMRRRQNNPILTGEAGVGKTAIVEGFALRVAMGHVPKSLQDIDVRILDLGLLQAGAGVRGEFEDRLKKVITEVKSSPKPIILFIDEAHTMIGAGAKAGQSDVANLLKPALARGELRTIAATTWSEYKKYFEKDPALARRFQVIQVEEPDEDSAIDMLRGIAKSLARYHDVRILDEALRDAVKLSSRYITGRQLPDKAVSVLDTACARVGISQRGTPPEVEAVGWELDRCRTEIVGLTREQKTGAVHSERLAKLTAEHEAWEQEWNVIEARWQRETGLVTRCIELRQQLDDQIEENDDSDWLRSELRDYEEELEQVQGESPLVPLCVDRGAVAAVVSGWTGIPVGSIVTDEISAVLSLRDELGTRIIGQPQALEAIARRIRTYRANMDEPGKPVGVFLLVGPSGVGKTETGIALAELLYGGERTMLTINMSEYQEGHSISGLRGAPPGYVGYGSGGVLTEGVRHTPYCVILLDEVEKAHPDVLELFYQVFDKGVLEDAEGQIVDFKNTIILMTSNLGADRIAKACQDDQRPSVEALVEAIRPLQLEHFKAALLSRMVIVPYYPLNESEIRQIVDLKLSKVQQRFALNHRAELSYDEELATAIARRCTEVDTGARNIDNILTNTLLPDLSAELLERMARGEVYERVHVSQSKDGRFQYTFGPTEHSIEDVARQPDGDAHA